MLARVSIVLVRPKYLENIGSAARAACTMGMGRLVVVGNRSDDLEPALKTATHNAADLIHGIVYHDTLAAAVAGYSLVVGTTARRGRQRMAMARAADLADMVMPALRQGPVALVFGPEDTGLANLELALCGLVVTIPAASRFSSINLAQAVMIVCYELYQGSERLLGQERGHGLYQPRQATGQEISAMVDAASHACQALDQGAVRKKADIRLRHLRQAVSRYPFSAREIKIMKDVCHHVVNRLQCSAGDEES
jgi:tRNA/rRNA methyltransferase